MKKILSIGLLLASLTVAAHADPKGVSIKTSGFDGTKEVSLKPYGSSSCLNMKQTCLSVGAVWKSSLNDLVGLDLHVLRDFVIMSDLLINIDGEIIRATRVTEASDLKLTGLYKQSFQRFVIKKSDFDKLLTAQKVWFKVDRTDGSYIETYLIDNGKDTLAFKALQRFSKQIQ
ncbi:hypothetical protein [Acinetobacter sp. 197]|uniref:hypothetical protein n=1 Tax=Acinetobacter sp. 197 TaxID=3114696 RepID=UPI003A8B334D